MMGHNLFIFFSWKVLLLINLLLLLFMKKKQTLEEKKEKTLSRSSSQDKQVREGDKTCNYSKANWDGISSTRKKHTWSCWKHLCYKWQRERKSSPLRNSNQTNDWEKLSFWLSGWLWTSNYRKHTVFIANHSGCNLILGAVSQQRLLNVLGRWNTLKEPDTLELGWVGWFIL